ncbi:hypothetical protein X953_03465 [Virgibacillus sp. SK37]|nr:hypothetical protein X953_03465 [Virgibacillus sp. SK37]
MIWGIVVTAANSFHSILAQLDGTLGPERARVLFVFHIRRIDIGRGENNEEVFSF